MAGLLEKYGIKEVADVTFYKISDGSQDGFSAGDPMYPVLYLDTLKVSTIEQTAEQASARGGKGNPELVTWDFGKEITVTLEDALFSAKSMAIMFSGSETTSSDIGSIMRTFHVVKNTMDNSYNVRYANSKWYVVEGDKRFTLTDAKFYSENGGDPLTVSSGEVPPSAKYVTGKLSGATGHTIEISGNSFPGTYYVTGDTYARSSVTGADDYFQFIIPKAKVQSENTITLEAEGDPSVFNMSLRVLRPESGPMMKLVQYSITGDVAGESGYPETVNG